MGILVLNFCGKTSALTLEIFGSFLVHSNFQVVCNKDGLYSSGCAVARAFPRYSQKAASRSVESVDVVFFRTDEDVPSRGLSEEDAFAFSVSGQSE